MAGAGATQDGEGWQVKTKAGTVVSLVARFPPLRRVAYRLLHPRARGIVAWIEPCLRSGDRIVDIGCGTGNVTDLLREAGWAVTAVDVEDLSLTVRVTPVLYGGAVLPFEADHFDVALIGCVLHHVRDHERLLREAGRVAPRLVVIEDVYRTPASRYATTVVDSLLTLEFGGHPHTNRTDAGWRRLFARLGLELRDADYRGTLGVIRQARYCLERRPTG
jgi:SAM-dependent methyltransferase